MTTASFGLYTREGDALAERLVRAICEDVEADRLTRRQALDRVADAMEQVAAIDEGMADPDATRAIAERLSGSFSRAGFVAIDGDELRTHFEEWSRKGAPVEQIALPEPVAMLSDATRALGAAASSVFGRGDVVSAVAEHDPLTDAFESDPAAKADIALFSYEGDYSRNPYVGCVLMGPDGWVFIETLAEHHDPAAALRDIVLRRKEVDYESLTDDLTRLASALDTVNVAASMLNEPGRLSLSLVRGEEGPTVQALWDGEPLGSARPVDAVSSTLLLSGPIDDSLLPEVLRGGHEPEFVPVGATESSLGGAEPSTPAI